VVYKIDRVVSSSLKSTRKIERYMLRHSLLILQGDCGGASVA